MKLCLGVFVKEPISGQVKTRLTPPLTSDQAADLYRAALHETVERVQTAGFDVVLFYSGGEAYFETAFPELPRIRQSDGDLGERLVKALDQLHQGRPAAAALIGSDSPDLPLKQIDTAFMALQENDVVTIPASDGGYILIGTRQIQPQVFQGIDWSTEKVLAQTRQRAVEAGLDYAERGGWEDVDDINSLQRLMVRSPGSATASHVRRHLKNLITD
jgi:rSAM/selenodomain-associated transferase 1